MFTVSTVNTQDQARFGPPRSCNLENKGVATGLMVCGGDSKVYSVSVVQTVSSTTWYGIWYIVLR